MSFWRKSKKRARERLSELDVMAGLLADRQVNMVFDVGANEGVVSRRYLQRFRPTRLFAFEPVTSNVAELKARMQDNPEVEVHQIALGNEDGQVAFNINKNSIYNNSLLPAARGGERWHDIEHVSAETIDCSRIDTFCRKHDISAIDILKVDTEGADLLVLEGAEGMLSEGRIALVYVEVLFSEAFEGQATLGRIIEFMEARSYVLYNFFGQKVDEHGRLFRADVLFVERSVLPG